MLISRNWLQTFFDQPLPEAEVLAEALTFHAFEIDGVEKVGSDDVLDVKVTPNRGHDCLNHRGIARELSAILQIPITHDPLSLSARSEGKTWPSGPERASVSAQAEVNVSIESTLCRRYVAAYIKNVQVGPSPQWFKTRLEAIGQRSINNVVDATNYIMFHLGQPLHAFDAGKLGKKPARPDESGRSGGDGTYALGVRLAKPGEKLIALDEKEYTLTDSTLVIVDQNKEEAVGVAGVKGGMPAGITAETKDIVLESANFDGVCVRKTAQALKLRTDASARFEQQISPELTAYGARAVVDLILELAGGELVGFVDEYPAPQTPQNVSVTVSQVKNVLGPAFGEKEIQDSFDRLGFVYTQTGDKFVVTPPFERLDLIIPEDLIEEVGRIQGYDKVPAVELPASDSAPEMNQNFSAAERTREELISQGFSEVLTSVFAEAGERVVLNKVDGVRPYLRSTLLPGLTEALKKNIPNKDLLGLKEIKLFEIGTVWKGGKEVVLVGVASEKGGVQENPLSLVDALAPVSLPEMSTLERYQPFSKYPYIVRDIAAWVPRGTEPAEVQKLIQNAAEGALLHKVNLFDRFEKGDRMSLAYRLIFQSFERTLTDQEVNGAMEKVYAALTQSGFEIR